MKQLAKVIKDRQMNDYDVNMMVDGERGHGKSTFIWKLFKLIGGFVPERDIVFSREDVSNSMKNKKYGLIFADEMINASYNRDFYNQKQKELNKIVNMYRDNHNIIAGAVPSFYAIDNQMRGLVKLRVTIVGRGFAVIQQSKQTMYSSDSWDTDLNKKIETKMIELSKRTGNKNINFSRLTTFWGVVKFGKMNKKDDIRYKKIKESKRARLMDDEDDTPKTDYQLMAELKKDGKLSNEYIVTYSKIHNKKYSAVIQGINEAVRNIKASLK